MSGYTPGPWRYVEFGAIRGGPVSEYVNGLSDEQIALAILPNREGSADVRDANARLIASAPDLLESSTELLGWIERQLVPTYSDRKPMPENLAAAILATKSAIAKAEGK